MITEAHLSGKVAIVTGSSRGIGAGIALELAKKGAHVHTTLVFTPKQRAACTHGALMLVR